MGRKSEWTEVIRALEAAGYTVTPGHSGHYGIYNRKGTRVWSLPYSPSDHRTYQNNLRDLKRRLGFEMPKKGNRSR